MNLRNKTNGINAELTSMNIVQEEIPEHFVIPDGTGSDMFFIVSPPKEKILTLVMENDFETEFEDGVYTMSRTITGLEKELLLEDFKNNPELWTRVESV